MMSSATRFWRSIRYIPPQQLLRRAWITARRRATMCRFGAPVRQRRLSPLPVTDEPPKRLFAVRDHLVERDGDEVFLKQLGGCWPVSECIDWQLTEDESPTHLQRLAMHYLEFIEAVDVPLARSVMLDWITNNPPWQPGYWLDSWNSYAVSIRTVCMMQWLADHPVERCGETGEYIISSIAEQIRFLSRNLELDIRGNHLMKNIKALLWAGRFFEGSESAAWTSQGNALLQKELEVQFLDDGSHFELSPAYHCQVFADVLDCIGLWDRDRSQVIIDQLAPAAQFLADMTHNDGKISLFSDGGLQMAYSPAECLKRYAQIGGCVPVAQSEFRYAESGYIGLKTDVASLYFDCGPGCADSLPAHGHGDILAFEWDLGEDRIVVDAGVYEYEAGEEREWNRSTRAHNTVTVGDRSQCEFFRNFRVGRRAHGKCRSCSFDNGTLTVTGAYTAYNDASQRIDHSRTLVADCRSLVIADDVVSLRPEPAVARLLLHHDCAIRRLNEREVAISRGPWHILLEADAKIELNQSKWSPNFGERYETTQIEVHYGQTPVQSGFRLTFQD